jgi:hypothetical protein
MRAIMSTAQLSAFKVSLE